MIFILNILIDLCLIFAIWKTFQLRKRNVWNHDVVSGVRLESRIYCLERRLNERIKQAEGERNGAVMQARIAEKMAERAFNLASSATIGVVALQKSLAVPRLMTKQQTNQNLLAKKEVDRLFTKDGAMEWLKPVLSDEELEIVEKAEELHQKYNGANE